MAYGFMPLGQAYAGVGCHIRDVSAADATLDSKGEM